MTQRDAGLTEALDWSHDVVDIPAGGLTRDRSASGEERAVLAATLGLLDLPELSCSYRITALAGGAYRLEGELSAGVVQACVVSLEPVPSRIAETFDIEFWPKIAARVEGEDMRVLAGRDAEELADGAIPVGRIVCETFSAGLDPYPRKEGAEFNWQDTAPEPGKTSPFSVLSQLKSK